MKAYIRMNNGAVTEIMPFVQAVRFAFNLEILGNENVCVIPVD